MKRKESGCAITCDPTFGPMFCEIPGSYDIFIFDKCNEDKHCFIHNNGEGVYECHPEHKSSLFVNTAGPDVTNFFSVLDYEVYTQY